MRKLIIGSLSLVIFSSVIIVIIGGVLIAPQLQEIGAPPKNMQAESVFIARENESPIAGWFIAGNTQQPGILLLHSVRSNRLEMIDRARFLYKAGYSILIIDMQSHGETSGEHLESRDAHMAFKYLKSRLPNQPIGVIGVSLGGAATLLGSQPIQADAIILESVYSTIERAIANRLTIRLGILGKYLAPLLLFQIEPRLGIPTESLSPVEAISGLQRPVFIIAGSDDLHTLLYETKQLYESASEPKLLWVVEGAKHQNLHKYATREYEQNILNFFSQYLDTDL